jgi:hypothetical protein
MTDALTLRRDGFGRLEASIPAETVVRLRAEALDLKATAGRVETDAYELHADGQDFRSPVQFGVSSPGEELRQLHESDELRALADELAGVEMTPSKVNYLYYETGDRIGLHTDLPACELVLLAAFDPVAPPLVVHPELRGLSPEELAELAEAAEGAPAGGLSIPLDESALVGLFGGGLPHQTRPVPPGSEAIVATLCYVALHP